MNLVIRKPHRFKTVDQSDVTEIKILLETLDEGNGVGDAGALEALRGFLDEPEVDRLSSEELKAMRAVLKAADVEFSGREGVVREAAEGRR